MWNVDGDMAHDVTTLVRVTCRVRSVGWGNRTRSFQAVRSSTDSGRIPAVRSSTDSARTPASPSPAVLRSSTDSARTPASPSPAVLRSSTDSGARSPVSPPTGRSSPGPVPRTPRSPACRSSSGRSCAAPSCSHSWADRRTGRRPAAAAGRRPPPCRQPAWRTRPHGPSARSSSASPPCRNTRPPSPPPCPANTAEHNANVRQSIMQMCGI